MFYVYSTATCPICYVKYKPLTESEKSLRGAASGHSEILKKVTIKGGHGVNTKILVTPKGVVTQVSDEDMEFLLKNESFQRHLKSGYMDYDKKKIDPEKKAKNMAEKDGSAPLTPKQFEKGENDNSDLRVYKTPRHEMA
jgi:hypothetical protein